MGRVNSKSLGMIVVLPNWRGLGFKDIMLWNKCAVFFQLWRIIRKDNSLWINWLYSSPFCNKAFWTMKVPPRCSWCLRKILNARAQALQFVKYEIGANSNFLMWHDPWANRKPILHQLHSSIVSTMGSSQLATVSDYFFNGEWQLGPSNHVDAIELRFICSKFSIKRHDAIFWDTLVGGFVTASSIWTAIQPPAHPPAWIGIVWHPFSVPKFSLLLWLVLQQRLLTKDRIIRFGMNTLPDCLLCSNGIESHEHLFWDCSFAKSILSSYPEVANFTWADIRNGSVVRQNLSPIRKHVTSLFLAVAFQAIWRERNERIHITRHLRTTTQLLFEIKERVKEKLFTCDAFKRGVRRDPTLSTVIF